MEVVGHQETPFRLLLLASPSEATRIAPRTPLLRGARASESERFQRRRKVCGKLGRAHTYEDVEE